MQVNQQPSPSAPDNDAFTGRTSHAAQPRWKRSLRRVLLGSIALLYAASIPWYRSSASVETIFGLPDWVAVAVLCYAAAAVLNSAAWLLTEIPETVDDRPERDS